MEALLRAGEKFSMNQIFKDASDKLEIVIDDFMRHISRSIPDKRLHKIWSDEQWEGIDWPRN